MSKKLHHYDITKVLDSYLIMFLIYVYKTQEVSCNIVNLHSFPFFSTLTHISVNWHKLELELQVDLSNQRILNPKGTCLWKEY